MKYLELTLEEYNAIMEARETINEFKSDITREYALKRFAEKQSGSHKIGKKMQNNDIKYVPATDKKKFVKRVAVNKIIRDTANDATETQDKKREENVRKASIGRQVHNSRHTGRENFKKEMPSTVRGMNRKIIDDKHLVGKEIKRDYGTK